MRSTLLIATISAVLTLTTGHALATGDGGTEGTSSGESETAAGDFSSAWFINPLPNAVYEGAPVELDVEIGVYQGLDDSISDVELLLDGASIGTQPCVEGCVFPGVVLEQGIHEFSLLATPNGDTMSVTVYVDTEIPSDTESGGSESGGSESGGSESGGSESSSSESSSGSGSGGDSGSEGGQLEASGGADEAEGGQAAARGCSAQHGPAAPWLLGVSLLVLGATSRRKQARAQRSRA